MRTNENGRLSFSIGGECCYSQHKTNGQRIKGSKWNKGIIHWSAIKTRSKSLVSRSHHTEANALWRMCQTKARFSRNERKCFGFLSSFTVFISKKRKSFTAIHLHAIFSGSLSLSLDFRHSSVRCHCWHQLKRKNSFCRSLSFGIAKYALHYYRFWLSYDVLRLHWLALLSFLSHKLSSIA